MKTLKSLNYKQKLPEATVGPSDPFLIVGCRRSGTTLLRLMLDHHPEIYVAGETGFIPECPSFNINKMNQYFEWLNTDRVFHSFDLQVNKELDFRSLIHNFCSQLKSRTTKQHFGLVIHENYELLPKIWKNSKYINITRDGRDVAYSYVKAGWAGNTWYGAHPWISAQVSWENLTKILPRKQILEISYESLVTEPEKSLARICEFLGLSFSKDVFKYSQTTTYSTPDANHTEQWKKRIGKNELRLIESQIGGWLEKKQYPLSGFKPKSPSPLKKLSLLFSHKLKRLIFRIQRYGIALFVLTLIADRVRIKSLVQFSKTKTNNIDKRYLK